MAEHPRRKGFHYEDMSFPHLGRGVFVVIGPFEGHKTDADLQRDIELAVVNFNRRHGFLRIERAE